MKEKFKKFILFITLTDLTLLFSVYFMITQPVLLNYTFPTHVKKKLHSDLQQKKLSTDANKLRQHVKWLSEQDRTSAIAQLTTVNYIITTLKQSGIPPATISTQKYKVNNSTYQNIIVQFKSTKKNAPTYLIGAHYDVFSSENCFATLCSHKGFPGADDNASGVAGLLEIARLLKQVKKIDKNIELVFYATEEPPFYATENMGSYKHAKHAKNIDLAIILEMIGYFSTAENSQTFPFSALQYIYPTKGNFIAIVSNFDNIHITRTVKKRFQASLKTENLIQVKSINAPTKLTGIDFSDHRNYWQFNIPALMITDTSFYRNFHYHTVNDTYDKLDYKKMKAVVDATIITVLSL